MLIRLAGLALVLLALVSCSKSSPTQPTPTTTTTTAPPQQTLYTITGTVSSAATGPLGNASVTVVDGKNAGLTSNTDGSGHYSLSGLTFAGFTVMASAPGHVAVSRGGILQPGSLTTTSNFTLLPEAIFSRAGTGDTVFDIPPYVTRVHIQANFPGNCQNFAVQIAGHLVVNIILGTCSVADARSFDGTYQIAAGGTAQITISTGVNWSITEVR